VSFARPKTRCTRAQAPLPQLPTVAAAEPHLPWRVAVTARLGRHAVAQRALCPGELVLREVGVTSVVWPDYLERVCHICFQELPAGSAPRPAVRCAAHQRRHPFFLSVPSYPSCTVLHSQCPPSVVCEQHRRWLLGGWLRQRGRQHIWGPQQRVPASSHKFTRV